MDCILCIIVIFTVGVVDVIVLINATVALDRYVVSTVVKVG